MPNCGLMVRRPSAMPAHTICRRSIPTRKKTVERCGQRCILAMESVVRTGRNEDQTGGQQPVARNQAAGQTQQARGDPDKDGKRDLVGQKRKRHLQHLETWGG